MLISLKWGLALGGGGGVVYLKDNSGTLALDFCFLLITEKMLEKIEGK